MTPEQARDKIKEIIATKDENWTSGGRLADV